jgi:16S rRNA (uracil1498-N3)-methyltransferase
MSERFFTSEPIAGDRATLSGADAHHLAHVMRAKVGETVTLFDGSGCEYVARIQSIGKRAVELTVIERRELDRESVTKLTLAVALPKGERQRVLVEKAVELGVYALVPLETERGVAQPTSTVVERLRRAVIEASKQCGRNRLMEIGEAQSWLTFVSTVPGDAVRLIAHPGGVPLGDVRSAASGTSAAREIVAAVGPEGGFTDEEVAAAVAAAWTKVDLGSRILRVETAAAALAAWASLCW